MKKKVFTSFCISFVICQSFLSRRNTFCGDDFGPVCDEKKVFTCFCISFVICQSFLSRRSTFCGDDFGLECDEKKKFLPLFNTFFGHSSKFFVKKKHVLWDLQTMPLDLNASKRCLYLSSSTTILFASFFIFPLLLKKGTIDSL
jgi:hypothetical protein